MVQPSDSRNGGSSRIVVRIVRKLVVVSATGIVKKANSKKMNWTWVFNVFISSARILFKCNRFGQFLLFNGSHSNSLLLNWVVFGWRNDYQERLNENNRKPFKKYYIYRVTINSIKVTQFEFVILVVLARSNRASTQHRLEFWTDLELSLWLGSLGLLAWYLYLSW